LRRIGAFAALAVAACGGAPTVATEDEAVGPPRNPTHFSAERFDANLRALVELGARPPGSDGLAAAERWARAHAPELAASPRVVLVAPLATGAARGDALADESSGAALALEAARALAASGTPVGVAFAPADLAAGARLADAELAVYVRRACALPERRDLLSHRVLRERFFRITGESSLAFEQADAPHDGLLAAGAKRVVALDAPRPPGAACAPAAFGDALVRFVSDATALLASGRSNTPPPAASQAGTGGANSR
jgi:hypothetical protein